MCCIAKIGNELLIAEEAISINTSLTIGQALHNNVIQISGFGKAGNAKLAEIKVIEAQTSTVHPDLEFVLLDATMTPITQGSTFAPTIAATNVQAVANIVAGDYVTIVSGQAYASKTFDQNVVADGTGTLYLGVVAKGSQAYTSATVTIKLVFHLFEC